MTGSQSHKILLLLGGQANISRVALKPTEWVDCFRPTNQPLLDNPAIAPSLTKLPYTNYQRIYRDYTS
jgi:hypothetical protein